MKYTFKKTVSLLLIVTLLLPMLPIIASADDPIYENDFEECEAGNLPSGYTYTIDQTANSNNVWAVADDAPSSTNVNNKSLKNYLDADARTNSIIYGNLGNDYTGKLDFSTKVYLKGDDYTKALFLLDGTSGLTANCIMAIYFDKADSGDGAKTFVRQYTASGSANDTALSTVISNDIWTDVKISIDTDKRLADVVIGNSEVTQITLNAKPDVSIKLHSFATYVYYRKAASYGSYIYVDDILIDYQKENQAPVIKKVIENQSVGENETVTLSLSDYFEDKEEDAVTYSAVSGEVNNSVYTFSSSKKGIFEETITATDSNGKSTKQSFKISVGTSLEIIYEESFEDVNVGVLPSGYTTETSVTSPNVSNVMAVSDEKASDGNKSLKHYMKADERTNTNIYYNLGSEYTGNIVFDTKIYTSKDNYTKTIYLLKDTTSLTENCILALQMENHDTEDGCKIFARQYETASKTKDTPINAVIPNDTWTNIKVVVNTSDRVAAVIVGNSTPTLVNLDVNPSLPISLKGFATYNYYRRSSNTASYLYADDIFIYKQDKDFGLSQKNQISSQNAETGVEFTLDMTDVFSDDSGEYSLHSSLGEFNGKILSYTPDTVGTKKITVTAVNKYGGILETSFDLIVTGNVPPVLKKQLEDRYTVCGNEIVVDLSQAFYDENGDELTFTSTLGTVVENKLYHTPQTEGIETVTVTACDAKQETVNDTFLVVTSREDGLRSVLYKEDFETTLFDTVPPNYTVSVEGSLTENTGYVKVVNSNSNNALTLSHATGGKTTARAVAKLPSSHTGDYSATMEVVFGGNVIKRLIYLRNSDGKEILSFGCESDSDVFRVGVGTSYQQFDDYIIESGKKYNITFEFKKESQTVDIYIDNVLVTTYSVSHLTESSLNIDRLEFYSYYRKATNSTHYLTVDNILLTADREITQEDTNTVNNDYDKLIWGTISYESQDGVTKELNLYDKGAQGSKITWQSSDVSVISSNGIVIRPEGADKKVLLTASVQKGNVSKKKTFEVTVLKSVPETKYELFKMDFEDKTVGERPEGWAENINPPKHNDTVLTVELQNGNKILKSNNAHIEEQTYPGYTNTYSFPETYNGEVEIELDYFIENTTPENKFIFYNSKAQQLFMIGGGGSFSYTANSKANTVSDIKLVANKWYKFNIIVNTETGTVIWYIDGEFAATFKATENISENYGVSSIALYNRITTTGINAMYVDNVVVKDNLTYKLNNALDNLSFDSYTVTSDFDLQENGDYNVAYTWESYDNNVIGISGNKAQVTRQYNDTQVTLKVTASLNGESVTKEYTFTVLKKLSALQAVEEDYNNLVWEDLSDEPYDAVTKNLKLPDSKNEGSSITWQSDSNALTVNGEEGIVAKENLEKQVTLTATIKKEDAEKIKTFSFKILKETGVNILEYGSVTNKTSELSGNPAKNVIDGNFKTVYKSLISDVLPEIIIDLGIKQSVDSGLVSAFSNLKAFAVYGSTDSLNYKEFYSYDLSGLNSENNVNIFEFNFESQDARYIKIALTPVSAGNVSVREIQLFNSQATDWKIVENALKLIEVDNKDKITEDLNLTADGPYGTNVSWLSSNTQIISNSGIVTRQSTDEEVTLKAIVSKNGCSLEKEFSVTVLATGKTLPRDTEEFTPFTEDVAAISDEDFFGVYNSESGDWEFGKTPKINYDYTPELKIVEDYVKKGDYESARSELVYYFKNRETNYPFISSSKEYELADLYINDIFPGSSAKYVTNFTVGDEEGEIEVDVSNQVKGRGSYTFYMVGKYKHQPETYFYTKEADGGIYAAKLTVIADGKELTYTVSKDTYVSPDTKMMDNFGMEEKMYVKETVADDPEAVIGGYGNLWSSDTKRPYFQFNVTGLEKETVITSAKITLYGKAGEDNTAITLWRDGNTSWNENTFNWRDSLTQVLSWNGMDPDWNMPQNADHGANNATCMSIARVVWMGTLSGCYMTSGDEYYAYHSIRQTLNMIDKTKDSVDFYNLQDLGIRAGTLVISYDNLRTSPYMSDAAAISYIKNLWQLNESLTYPANFQNNHNHGIFSNRGQMRITMYFPEFVGYEEYRTLFIERWNDLANSLINDNGNYLEATSHYTDVTLQRLQTALEDSETYGFELDSVFKVKLEKLAEYLANMILPNGRDPMYGDSTYDILTASVKAVAEGLDSDTLRYIVSNGREGTAPDYLSKYYTGSNQYVVLRDSFDENAVTMHTNLGYGDGKSHTHFDNLALMLYAYGSVLLTDNGHYTYSDTEISNWLRYSTESHNTVNINGLNQGYYNDTMNEFTTNDKFDYMNATSSATMDSTGAYKHTRSVLFSKSQFFVVGDRIVPPNSNVNRYDQNWHFRPGSNWVYDETSHMLETHFEDGANLIISQVDNADLIKRDGYFSQTTDTLEETKYATFRQNKSGIVTYDTVLYPKQAGDSSSVTTTRIGLDVDTTIATAFYIDIDDGKTNKRSLYYQSYENAPTERLIDNVRFTGQALLIDYDQSGDVIAITVVNGKKLSLVTDDGEVSLLMSNENIADIFVDYNYNTLELTSSSLDMNTVAGLKVYAEENISNTTLNGSSVAVSRNDNQLTIGNIDASGNNKITVSQITETVDSRPVTFKQGTVTEDYVTTVSYGYKNVNYKATLTVPSGSVLKGPAMWDGTLPQIRLSAQSERTVNGTVKAYLSFSNTNITSDTPFVLTVEISNGLSDAVYVGNELYTASVSNNLLSVSGLSAIDVTLYEAYLTPPGGGAGGGGSAEDNTAENNEEKEELITPDTPDDTDSANISQFTDIEGHWAYDNIIKMVEMGYIKGISDTLFSPDTNIKRSEFAAIIKRVLSLPDSDCSLEDVSKNEWYYKEVGAVVNAGIMKGYNGNFRPNDNITREEIAVVLINVYEKYIGVLDTNINKLDKFEDRNTVSEWAYSYIAKAIETGIMQGMSETNLSPKESATRAQGTTMILRLYNLIKNSNIISSVI